MGRRIKSRIKLSAKLTAKSALHVGGAESGLTDMPVALDGVGNCYIPGTGLAGALRAWLGSHYANDIVEKWWGKADGGASRVFIDDAVITLPAGGTIEVRDGVGIDRVTGAAADRAKYDMNVVPSGSTFNLNISVDVPPDSGEGECINMLNALAYGLKQGFIRVGACKTRGMGKIVGSDVKLTKFDLSNTKGMIAYLDGESGTDVYKDNIELSDSAIRFTIKWQPVGPLMVKAGFDGIAVDTLPLAETVDDSNVALLLPGSSIKGAFRSRAEKIVRTLLGRDIAGGFLDQVKVPIVDLLFGAAGESKDDQKTLSVKTGVAAAHFSDCYSSQTLSRNTWANIITSNDEKALNKSLQEPDIMCLQEAYHVAVDRWTAAVKDGALFTVLEPHCVKWEPIEIVMQTHRFKESESAKMATLALLLLVLRDFSRGDIPLGFAVNRGLGDVKIDSIAIDGGGVKGTITNGKINLSDGYTLDDLNRSWTSALEEIPKVKEAEACAS